MICLPNELLMRIIQLTDRQDLTEYLFVCKYTFHLVRQRVYKKVIFPDSQVTEADVIRFFKLYANSIETIKLPQSQEFSSLVYEYILIHCPRLDFLQSSIYPKQLKNLKYLMRPSTCFMITEIPVDLITHHHDLDIFHSSVQTTTYFPCCPSFFIFPSELVPEKNSPLTQISHYFHHPGALSNAILPTFGSDLIALTLNPYDVLTASVARLIVAKCPRLRYLVVPSVKAEGLWMLLRWCHTLTAIVVGDDHSGLINEDGEEEEDEEDGEQDQDHTRRLFIEIENQRSVETIQNHKRVWCLHSSFLNTAEKRTSWHIGIIPRL